MNIEGQPPVAAEELPPEVVEGEEPDTQTQEQDQTPQSEAQDEKKSSPVQKRINELTWKAHEAERRANAAVLEQQKAEQVALQLWEQQQELHRRVSMPRLDQYGMDVQQYERAMEAHNQQFLQQQRAVQQELAQKQQAAQAQAQFQTQLNARIAEGNQKYPDYEEVVNNPALPTLSQVNPMVLGVLMGHENMPEITYYLGKNPAEAHRIASMSPAMAILEVGKIAARLPANIGQRNSRAPAPPSQVGGNTRANNAPSDSDSMEEWQRKREAQLKRR